MIVRWLAVFILLGSASAARAADWWWVGINGNAPNRVLTYVDRASVRQIGGGAVEVWLLAYGETALPNGQQHQANHWAVKCGRHTLSMLGRIALNPAWQRLPFADPAPTAYAPVTAGSIGESALNFICGHPSGNELHVAQPTQHALDYLQSNAAQARAPAGGPPGPAPGNPADAGRQGRPRPSGQPGGAPAQASEWWWIGPASSNGRLAYVDRAAVRRMPDGRMEVYLLDIYGTPLANGTTREVGLYLIDCRTRQYERTGALAMDEEGHNFPSSETAPQTGTIPPGTVGDRVYGLACGQPSERDVRIDNPLAHAGVYFHRQYADLGNGPPASGSGTDGGGLSVGTAFFVGPEGYALTAYHVVDGADRLACRTGDGEVHEAVVARMNQANDVALLRMNFRPTRYLGLAPPGSLRTGERVFTIGYGAPSYLGINEPRFTEGVVSALSGLQANDAEVQITVPIQPGNSGGPLVNEAGQLVGIITATAAADAFQQEVGATPQSINWAVKADYAAPLLPHLPPARPMTRTQAIALTHDAVCFVMALHERGDSGGATPSRQ